MSKKDSLEEYQQKRDFRRTTEPQGDAVMRGGEGPIFVIHKHDASNLHYDFRLEVDGVLKSWAVPKGPSTDPREKRLAIPSEDHPLEYADFEGGIPQDEYGGGTVMVWDTGPYRNLRAERDEDDGRADMQESLEQGTLEVWLEGEKLQGGYALVRTGSGEDARWLLIKMDDEKADARRNPTGTQADSVISGRSLDEIAEAAEETE